MFATFRIKYRVQPDFLILCAIPAVPSQEYDASCGGTKGNNVIRGMRWLLCPGFSGLGFSSFEER